MTTFLKTREGVPTPKRAHPTDAGVDLTANAAMIEGELRPAFGKAHIARAGGTAIFGTGIAVAIPEGHVGLLHVRSSLGIKRHLVLANGTGIIDAPYRGEILACLRNEGDFPATINHGERIVQLVIVPCDTTDWQETDDLDTTDRGDGGIGSTGA